MDSQLSEITTIEDDEEDDEPLFEITRVKVINPQKNIREGRQTKYIKICYVPLCPNTSKSTPEKMFITVPVNPFRRQQWLDVVGKTIAGRNPKSPMFCCQDHFNLRRDMKNYDEHIRKGKVQMLLYHTVVPSVFICNKYGHLKRVERIRVLRQLHEKQNLLLRNDDDDDEPEIELTPITRLTPRQRSLQASRRKKLIVPNKTIFIEMPEFEEQHHSGYVNIKEDEVDTIIIDDSD